MEKSVESEITQDASAAQTERVEQLESQSTRNEERDFPGFGHVLPKHATDNSDERTKMKIMDHVGLAI
jgi:hypothetical protein